MLPNNPNHDTDTRPRWRSGQPPGEPARNNIPVSWKKKKKRALFILFYYYYCLLLFLIARRKICGIDNTDGERLYVPNQPMTVNLHTAFFFFNFFTTFFSAATASGRGGGGIMREKLAGGR